MQLQFDTAFEPAHGEAVPVAPGILRVTARNIGPFTFQGTNSYVVGSDSVLVLDPGPADAAHLAALAKAIGGRRVDAILLTHTHRDHTGLATALREATGAPLLAEGRHRPARSLHSGEVNVLDAAGDNEFVPDRVLRHDERAGFPAAAIRVIATPGHTANHLAFALEGSEAVFTGDHVMAWSTTIVAPPDGSMRDYMDSLDRLLARDDRLFFPGHGGPVARPQQFMRGLKAHRKMRERAILERVREGDRTIPEIVRQIYSRTDPRLFGAAGLSVLAHLEDLAERGLVLSEGPPLLNSRYTPA